MVRLTFLADSFADRPAQLDRLQRLHSLVEAKLAEFREVTKLKQSGQDEKAIRAGQCEWWSLEPSIRSARLLLKCRRPKIRH